MNWEVKGANRVSGEDQTLAIEADDTGSAVRRGTRRGLVVEWARPLDEQDSVAGVPRVTADVAPRPAVPTAPDSVGYAYVAPAFRRRRKKSSGGVGMTVAIVLLIAGGAGWWGWQATRPAETVAPTDAGSQPVKGEVAAPAVPPTAGRPVIAIRPKVPAVPSMHVTAGDVLRAHAAGAKLAAANYSGRTIAVEGRVETVGTGIFGTPCIGLGGAEGATTGRRIQCVFSEDDAATLNALRAGDTVTVFGRYDGVNGEDVQLVGCQVSANPATQARDQGHIHAGS